MSADFDKELLRPTLSDADDAVGFDRPWNPWSLVTLTFFFGLIAGGALLALNFRRLGMNGRLYPALAVVAVGSLLIAGGFEWAIASGIINPHDRDAARTGRWIVRGASCLIAMAVALPQQRRFRLFQASGLPAGHLLWPAVAAAAVSLPLAFALRMAFATLFR